MITRFNKFTLITESPDHIDDYKGNHLNVSNLDAYGFHIVPTKDHTKVRRLVMTSSGGYHGNYLAYPGRLWKDSKVIDQNNFLGLSKS